MNGIDYDRFQRDKIGSANVVTIGSVGALRPEKNYQRLLQSFSEASVGTKARLQIYGDGPQRQTLEAIAVEKFGGASAVLRGGDVNTRRVLSGV